MGIMESKCWIIVSLMVYNPWANNNAFLPRHGGSAGFRETRSKLSLDKERSPYARRVVYSNGRNNGLC